MQKGPTENMWAAQKRRYPNVVIRFRSISAINLYYTEAHRIIRSSVPILNTEKRTIYRRRNNQPNLSLSDKKYKQTI